MWIAILFLGLAFFVGHALYFSARLKRATALVLPRTRHWLGPLRAAYLVVALSVPILSVGYLVYALIARPETIGPPDSRLYDYLVEVPFWLLTITSLQCSLVVVPIDLVHLAPPRPARVLCIAAATAAFVPARMALDATRLEVRVHEYASAELPAALDRFEIALIADMQADQYTGPERLSQLVDAANRAKPDLVLIAGDMITRAPRYIQLAAEQTARLRAPYGVLACIGDHDNFAYRDRERSLREVREALARRGVPMLDNQVRELRVGDARVALIFATQNYVSQIDRKTTRALLDRAAGADLVVLLSHQPAAQLIADARAGGVDLFLSGHTHGGQINLWLPFLDLTPARFETRYVSGPFQLGRMLLVVSNGLGMSLAPFRYRAPAT
ncbi:MAG TPA: metallophosphoesterase, partial [Candidatus Acidoferrum sp.]|nr:metallophosphoesterase [Candidatus Acidoferrum sp.]